MQSKKKKNLSCPGKKTLGVRQIKHRILPNFQRRVNAIILQIIPQNKKGCIAKSLYLDLKEMFAQFEGAWATMIVLNLALAVLALLPHSLCVVRFSLLDK